jgi:hypothetical protein
VRLLLLDRLEASFQDGVCSLQDFEAQLLAVVTDLV